ncbi:MAG: hypothetical protein J0L56_07540 [Chitinophagales bacterium]|nr:hypothetical protein [Chitinophagales bacterium]
MNTLTYILYLLITWFITVHVGFVFYRNGRLYILRLLKGDEKLTGFINKALLVGYYLLNLGYAALMIRSWKTIHTWTEMLVSITHMTGKIMLTLAVIHFINMAVIFLFSQKQTHSLHHKSYDHEQLT